jgi:hypothetical protein
MKRVSLIRKGGDSTLLRNTLVKPMLSKYKVTVIKCETPNTGKETDLRTNAKQRLTSMDDGTNSVFKCQLALPH